MPRYKTYQGRPVKDRRPSSTGGLILTFYNSERGAKGEEAEVTQDEWHEFGEETNVSKLPDVRAIAKQFE